MSHEFDVALCVITVEHAALSLSPVSFYYYFLEVERFVFIVVIGLYQDKFKKLLLVRFIIV